MRPLFVFLRLSFGPCHVPMILLITCGIQIGDQTVGFNRFQYSNDRLGCRKGVPHYIGKPLSTWWQVWSTVAVGNGFANFTSYHQLRSYPIVAWWSAYLSRGMGLSQRPLMNVDLDSSLQGVTRNSHQQCALHSPSGVVLSTRKKNNLQNYSNRGTPNTDSPLSSCLVIMSSFHGVDSKSMSMDTPNHGPYMGGMSPSKPQEDSLHRSWPNSIELQRNCLCQYQWKHHDYDYDFSYIIYAFQIKISEISCT